MDFQYIKMEKKRISEVCDKMEAEREKVAH